MRKTTLALFAVGALTAVSAAASDLPTQAPGAPLQDTLEKAAVFAARQAWDDAIAAYRVAIAKSPNDPALHNRLGICYQQKGDAKAARSAYKKALDIRKDYPEAWNNLGTIEHARGKYKQAVAAYSRAIRVKPQAAVFHKNLGAAWLARGDVERRSRSGTRPSVSTRRSSRRRRSGSGGRGQPLPAVLPLRQAARGPRRDREGPRVPGEGARGGLPRLRKDRRRPGLRDAGCRPALRGAEVARSPRVPSGDGRGRTAGEAARPPCF